MGAESSLFGKARGEAARSFFWVGAHFAIDTFLSTNTAHAYISEIQLASIAFFRVKHLLHR